jgi:hypothetical protein
MPGAVASFALTGLSPQTHYWVGVRAHDHCLNNGPVSIIDFVTPRAPNGSVAACFVATAAFGSPMEPKVALLRSFRDRILEHWAFGELFVESYYTFGPGVAGVIAPSDPLRALARTALGPLVDAAAATAP